MQSAMLQSVPPTHHTPGSVLQLADSLPAVLPRPLPPVAQAQLASLCAGLKAVGRSLEPAHATRLDILQERLTELCQDPGLPVSLRLQLLEVIELRSLGWEAGPAVETYYRERLQRYRPKEGTGPASLPALPEESATATEVVLGVRGAELTIQSACPKAVALAGKVLREFFAREASPPPQVQYSREMILELASSPMASLPPAAWERLAKGLPSVVVRQWQAEGAGDGPQEARGAEGARLPGSLPLRGNL